jgi:hypothetical protein
MLLKLLEKLGTVQEPIGAAQRLCKDPSEIGFRERVWTM